MCSQGWAPLDKVLNYVISVKTWLMLECTAAPRNSRGIGSRMPQGYQNPQMLKFPRIHRFRIRWFNQPQIDLVGWIGGCGGSEYEGPTVYHRLEEAAPAHPEFSKRRRFWMVLVTNVIKSKGRESLPILFLPLVTLTCLLSRTGEEGPATSALMLHNSW